MRLGSDAEMPGFPLETNGNADNLPALADRIDAFPAPAGGGMP